ncbi:MAG: hypothetical protein IPI24_03555 [Ignavibacteria bacterium]|nr:hypothetical protein [Ignavibacteria bacterium]MBK7576493.1 hypothetical protein [Ignavibacteria bacterium]
MKQSLLALLTIAAIPFLIAWLVPDEHVIRRESIRTLLTEISSKLRSRSVEFDDVCLVAQSTSDLLTLRTSYADLRIAYKSAEPLLEYIDPISVTTYINGAPLPKLDVKSQFVDVLEPQGLQVIDELLYGDDTLTSEDLQQLRVLSSSLRTSLQAVTGLMITAPWTDRMIIEAARSGVMRITTMGITGFDRPASDPRITDDLPALETVRRMAELFRPALASRGGKVALVDIVTELIDSASLTLRSSTFDDLDRAEFIRTTLDPLYGRLLSIQLALEIELSTEIGPSEIIVNPTARSMFATDVLYPSASSGITRASITPNLVELGRTLFFDPILSATGERACASCHDPAHGFTDGRRASMAMGRTGTLDRNTPTLINAVHSRRFFSDLRAMRVRDVIAHVVTNEKEFNSTLLEMVGRLRTSDEYISLFSQAFGGKGPASVDATNVGIAISAYLTTLVSFDSRFDKYLRGEAVSISASERRGFSLFTGRAACASCHFPPTYAGYVPPSFIDSESEIIGVPLRHDTVKAIADPDPGRAGGIDRENALIYRGSFKTPTVRNIALTAPYFHNGAYTNLEDVVDLYARGGGRGIGLDVPFQTLPFDNLNLSTQDRTDLIAFMNALTDTTGLTRRPSRLPKVSTPSLRDRVIGGEY